LRETAASFGHQRIYASHNSIMFARKACYCFVRPKRKQLEVIFFLGRTLKAAQVRKTVATSRVKIAHVVHVTHRDEVEPPLTDWLSEAYEASETLSARRPAPPAAKQKATKTPKKKATQTPKKKTRRRR